MERFLGTHSCMQICQPVSKFISFLNSLQNDTVHKEKSGKSPLSFLWHIGRVSTPAMANQGQELSKSKTLQGAPDSQLADTLFRKNYSTKQSFSNNNDTNQLFFFMEIRDKKYSLKCDL